MPDFRNPILLIFLLSILKDLALPKIFNTQYTPVSPPITTLPSSTHWNSQLCSSLHSLWSPCYKLYPIDPPSWATGNRKADNFCLCGFLGIYLYWISRQKIVIPPPWWHLCWETQLAWLGQRSLVKLQCVGLQRVGHDWATSPYLTKDDKAYGKKGIWRSLGIWISPFRHSVSCFKDDFC